MQEGREVEEDQFQIRNPRVLPLCITMSVYTPDEAGARLWFADNDLSGFADNVCRSSSLKGRSRVFTKHGYAGYAALCSIDRMCVRHLL